MLLVSSASCMTAFNHPSSIPQIITPSLLFFSTNVMNLGPVDEINLAKWMLQESPPQCRFSDWKWASYCTACSHLSSMWGSSWTSYWSIQRLPEEDSGLCSCITGCRDEGVRSCLWHHSRSLLFYSFGLFPPFLFLPHLTLFPWVTLLSCLLPLFYPVCLNVLISFIKTVCIFCRVLSFMPFTCLSSPFFFFGRGSCKHSCLCLHIYIQHHLSGFMAWQSPLQPEWMAVLLPLMSTLSLLLAQALTSFTGCNAVWSSPRRTQWAVLYVLCLFKKYMNATWHYLKLNRQKILFLQVSSWGKLLPTVIL